MKKVRIGVVGVGLMGRKYVEMIKSTEGLEVAALCNRHTDKIEDLPGEKFTDFRALIGSGKVDAVVIATPHWNHPEVAIEALDKGLHVLTDKPLAVHVADGRRMLAAYQKRKAGENRDSPPHFGVIFNERTRPACAKIKSMVDGGELGKLHRVTWIATGLFRSHAYYASGGWRATWKGEGGGVLINQAPHNLDLLQWFVGMPSRVTAKIGLGKYHPIEVEDDVTALLEYPGGATGIFAVSTGEAPGTHRLEISGDKGKLEIDTANWKIKFFKNDTPASEFSRTTKELFSRPPSQEIDIPAEGDGESHVGMIKNFRDAILNGAPLLCPAEEAIRSLELGNAMLLSGLSGKSVGLPLDAAAMEKEMEKLVSGKN